MITLFGDCEKQDLSVILALTMSCYEDKNYGIITDRKHSYSYTNESISGIDILSIDYQSRTLYDMHTSSFSKDGRKYMVTDGSPQSISSILSVGYTPEETRVIYLDKGSKEGEIAVKNSIGNSTLFRFPDNPARRIDMLNLGNLKSTHIDGDTEKFLKEFLKSEFSLGTSDISSIIKGVRRRLK